MRNTKLDILFEDNCLLVLNKPAGIATQTDKIGEEDIESLCKKYRKGKGEAPEIYIVHRLDQPVSGILVVAKTKEAASALSKGILGEYTKDYTAKVFLEKQVPAKQRLENFLVKDSKTSKALVVSETTPGAKKAVLSFDVISQSAKTAVLNVHLETGRFHQIRVQLANAGMPIIGDLKYGTKASIDFSKEQGNKTLCLCASHLKFSHPITGKEMEISIEQ